MFMKEKARIDCQKRQRGAIEQQALGIFSKSFSKRHEFWSKKDILLIALQTLPKQVKKKNRPDNLLKMRREFLEKLVEES